MEVKNMTVKELVGKLKDFDSNATVIVAVYVYTRAYSVAGVTPFEVDQGYGGCALSVLLPDNMHVVERTKRPIPRYTPEEQTARRKAREREIANA